MWKMRWTNILMALWWTVAGKCGLCWSKTTEKEPACIYSHEKGLPVSELEGRVDRLAAVLHWQLQSTEFNGGKLLVGYVGDAIMHDAENVVEFKTKTMSTFLRPKELLGVTSIRLLEHVKILILKFGGNARINFTKDVIYRLLIFPQIGMIANNWKDQLDGVASEKEPKDPTIDVGDVSSDNPQSQSRHTNTIPNDPLFPYQWGLHNPSGRVDIRGIMAWNHMQEQDVEPGLIGIIDTGFDVEHEDLKDSLWVNPNEIPNNGIDDDNNGCIDDIHGCDFGEEPHTGTKLNWNFHGTQVAGIIGATTDNKKGIAGMFRNAKMIVAVSSLESASTVECMNYMVKMKVRVTNNSYGSMVKEHGKEWALQSPDMAGHIYVRSAGNSDINIDDPEVASKYSPEMSNAIVVAAMDREESLSFYCNSNYGARRVHLAAPGELIWTTSHPKKYQLVEGTSFATPFVTAVAAMILFTYPQATPEEVKKIILETVTRSDQLKGMVSTGGYLNAYAAQVKAQRFFANAKMMQLRDGMEGTMSVDKKGVP